jgi:hypothetical protein
LVLYGMRHATAGTIVVCLGGDRQTQFVVASVTA